MTNCRPTTNSTNASVTNTNGGGGGGDNPDSSERGEDNQSPTLTISATNIACAGDTIEVTIGGENLERRTNTVTGGADPTSGVDPVSIEGPGSVEVKMPDSPGMVTLTASIDSASVTKQIQVKSPTITNLKAVPGTEQVTLSWEISPECKKPPEVKIHAKTDTHGTFHNNKLLGVGDHNIEGNLLGSTKEKNYTVNNLQGGVSYTFILKINGQVVATSDEVFVECARTSYGAIRIHVTSTVTNIITNDLIKGPDFEGPEIIGVSGSQMLTMTIGNEDPRSHDLGTINWKEDMTNQWKEEKNHLHGMRGEYPTRAGEDFEVTISQTSFGVGYTIQFNSGEDNVFLHLGGDGCRSEGCIPVSREMIRILHCATRDTSPDIRLTHEVVDEIPLLTYAGHAIRYHRSFYSITSLRRLIPPRFWALFD